MNKLERLSQELDSWRSNGRQGGKIPESIKKKAVDLLSSNKPGRISRFLRISSQTLSSWQEDYLDQEPTFIELPSSFSDKKFPLKISHQGISLEGELSISDWKQALGLIK